MKAIKSLKKIASARIENHLHDKQFNIMMMGFNLDKAGEELVDEELDKFQKKPSTIILNAVADLLKENENQQKR